MKKAILAIVIFLCGGCGVAVAQSNNPLSIYEGENIESVNFNFKNLPSDTIVALNITQNIENSFKIYPNSHYNSFMADYYQEWSEEIIFDFCLCSRRYFVAK